MSRYRESVSDTKSLYRNPVTDGTASPSRKTSEDLPPTQYSDTENRYRNIEGNREVDKELLLPNNIPVPNLGNGSEEEASETVVPQNDKFMMLKQRVEARKAAE
jgi:hypothetical protein